MTCDMKGVKMKRTMRHLRALLPLKFPLLRSFFSPIIAWSKSATAFPQAHGPDFSGFGLSAGSPGQHRREGSVHWPAGADHEGYASHKRTLSLSPRWGGGEEEGEEERKERE